MSVFNEAEQIEKAILSVVRYVDKIIVLDGAFYRFMLVNNLDNFLSDDGTCEKVEKLREECGKIIFIKPRRPWKNEVEKRSYFFRFGKEGDIFFVLDGNEECVGDVESGIKKIHESSDNAFLVRIHDLGLNTMVWRIRFYRWQPNMRYEENHWTVVGDRYEIRYVSSDPPEYPQIDDFYIVNHPHEGERKKVRDNYFKYMISKNWKE